MNKKEIEAFIKDKHWYYYYNFDGVEVNAKKKRDEALGVYNWNRIKPVMNELFSLFDRPSVLDIGCNMGLYDHEMTRMGADVLAIDMNTDHIEFYKKFMIENRGKKWKPKIKRLNITEEIIESNAINIVTMFCVLYHLRPYQEKVFSNLIKNIPNHRFIVLQGNIPRVVKKNQKEAGVEGMKEILEKHSYSIYRVYRWNNYQKPIVIGERRIS